MANFNIPNDIVADTPMEAGPVQANYESIASFLNNEVVHVDGSKGFTALPTAPADEDPELNELVTYSALQRQSRQVVKRIKNDSSLYGFGPSWEDLGVTLGPFDWPAIKSNRAFQVSLYVPEIQAGTYDGGAWPTHGITLEVGLFLGATLLQVAHVTTTSIDSLGDDDIDSLYLQRTWFDNTSRPAGTSTTLELKGRIRSGGGKFQLQGTSNAPIEFIGRLL